jgi:multiple sugar transport system permease protein
MTIGDSGGLVQDEVVPAAVAATQRPRGDGSRHSRRRRRRPVFAYVAAVVLVVWTLIPFLVTISTSFKVKTEVFGNPGLIPRDPTLAAYREVLGSSGFHHSLLNSVIVGIGTTVLTLVISVPAAYAFVRFKFKGRHLLLLFTLIPRLVPTTSLLVPLYRMSIDLHVYDRLITLIVVDTALVAPLGIWLLVGFYQKIPRDMEEAAGLDGAGIWQVIRYVVIPLSLPALITIGVLAFREAWNEFTLVLVLTSPSGARTLSYELFHTQGGIESIPNYPGAAAFALLTIVPFVLVYTRIERYVVQGITAGAGK